MSKTTENLIAIVDDDDGARESLQFLLGVLGRRAKAFASAAEFLDREPNGFACLILDQHMPAMTGLDLARRVRENDPRIPIMLVSGDLSADVAKKAVEAGVNVVAEKPLEMAALSRFLDRVTN